MSTDISVHTTTSQVERRSWLLSPHGTEPGTNPSVTVDFNLVASNRRTNGYLPSGTVLGRITATGKVAPYDNTASDGRETAVGVLLSSVRTPDNLATGVGAAILVHGFVSVSKLPWTTGAGALDTAGRADLPLIHFSA